MFTPKKPKMTFTDYFYLGFSVLYIVVVAMFLGFIIIGVLGSCTADDGDGILWLDYHDIERSDPYSPPERALSTIELYGPNQPEYCREGGTEPNFSWCPTAGGVVSGRIEGLHTGNPVIPGNYYDINCDPLEEGPNQWFLHCEYYHWCPTCYPWFWTYYDFYLDKLNWDEKEYIGWAFITTDLAPYFWCTMQFRITDAQLTYVWK